ncbi:MAG TPA: GNAT family N-acetyltransferase [Xanthobacteraceae bacterium]
MVVATATSHRGVRLLVVDDIERVIAIDRSHSGHTRRRFFEKNFAAAKARPDEYIHVGVMRGGSLRGFAIARILRGEFGREDAVAVLDAVGVEMESQERGVGQALMEELADIMRRKGVRSLQSQSDWTHHDILRFFAASGFQLAPRLALERSIAELLDEASEEV